MAGAGQALREWPATPSLGPSLGKGPVRAYAGSVQSTWHFLPLSIDSEFRHAR
ncbi:Uncharacterized protein PPKH_2006 [Pseudomonas putida]|nr:Uncharacterized protein PPKH_2006 [Pseudomonas putida]